MCREIKDSGMNYSLVWRGCVPFLILFAEEGSPNSRPGKSSLWRHTFPSFVIVICASRWRGSVSFVVGPERSTLAAPRPPSPLWNAGTGGWNVGEMHCSAIGFSFPFLRFFFLWNYIRDADIGATDKIGRPVLYYIPQMKVKDIIS